MSRFLFSLETERARLLTWGSGQAGRSRGAAVPPVTALPARGAKAGISARTPNFYPLAYPVGHWLLFPQR